MASIKSKDVESQRSPPGSAANFMDSKEVRQKFLTKVYTILTAQVICTSVIVLAFINVTDLNNFAKSSGYGLMLLCQVFALGLLIALSCCVTLRRAFPINFILLFAFTCFEAVTVSVICVNSPLSNVYSALLLTTGLFVFLTGLAYLNIIDITNAGGVICFATLIIAVLGTLGYFICAGFGLNPKLFHFIMCGVTLLLAMIWIVYDTQLLIGQGKNKLSEEEYIEGALMIYIDLITIFMNILSILNSLSGEERN